MKSLAAVFLAVALAASAYAQQQPTGDHAAHHGVAATDGEIRKAGRDGKEITIKHGPIPSLDMPAITMVFQVEEATMLDKVKRGDKVKFQAEKLASAFNVTAIEVAK